MARYRQTLLFIFVLLVVTAVGIFASQGDLSLFDLNTPRGQLLLVIGGVVGALAAVVVVGGLFAFAVNTIAGSLAEEKTTRPPGPAPLRPPAEKKAEASPAPNVPLYDNRSLTIFYLVIGVGVFVFLMVRWLATGAPPGYPLDRLPALTTELFQIGGFSITAGMALGAVVLAVLGGVLVTGAVLAFIAARVGKQIQSEEARLKAAEEATKKPAPARTGAAAKAAPAGEAKAPAPAVPLYDNRSLITFYIVLSVAVVAFLLFRWLSTSTPLGYVPTLEEAASTPLFRIPGEPIEGVPAFIPAPGNDVTALQVFIAVLVILIGATVVVGVALARGVARFSETEKALEKAPPAWPAPQIAALEPRLRQVLARPFPRRLTWLDQLILLLFAVIAVLAIGWVMPNILLARQTDRIVEATRLASLWTPTPQPGPTATPGPVPEALLADLPEGDPANGKLIAEGKGACAACHIGADPAVALQGPPWLAARSPDGKGIADHAQERFLAADYTGRATTPEGYLYESLIAPNVYVVSGFNAGVMPQTYNQLLTPQEQADVIAYLLSLR